MPSIQRSIEPTIDVPGPVATAARASVEMSAPTTEDFVARHPWPAAWVDGRSTLEYLWTYEFDAPPEAVWPLVADTQHFNKRMGLVPVVLREVDGRVFGHSVVAGITSEWEELPWEWEYAREVAYDRAYSRGPTRYARVRISLTPLPGGRTRVCCYTGIVPDGFTGRWLTKLGMPNIEKKHRQVMEDVRQCLVDGTLLADLDPSAPLDPFTEEKLVSVGVDMMEAGIERGLVDAILDHVRTAPEDELARLRMRPLARRLQVEESALLHALLHATRRGLFRLSWDVICPHCRGARDELRHLGDVPAEGSCEPCGIEFASTGPNGVEISFRVHEGIKAVQRRVYCSAEPMAKPHVKLQESVAPGEEATVEMRLPPGRYRLRLRGAMRYDLLDIREDGDDVTPTGRWVAGAELGALTSGPELRLTLVNAGDAPAVFVIAEHDDDRAMLRPADLFSFQEFRDLFTEEAVATGMQLDIGVQTILFTDIVGSSAFYAEHGDAEAFAEVREHFVRTIELVKRNRGALVKTIGDAAMAAFVSPVDALRAAVEIQRAFVPSSGSRLQLRITLHQGPCIAVNLNAGIDYFGRTVNFAAKLQNAAGAHEIVFAETIMEDSYVCAYLEDEGLTPAPFGFKRPWDGAHEPAFRLTITEAGPAPGESAIRRAAPVDGTGIDPLAAARSG